MSTTWSDVIEQDLSWREAELASLKRLALFNKDNEVVFTTLLRASWAMLYAHYEGFTKFCWELLFDEIQKKHIKISDLNTLFQKLALEKHFSLLRRDTSTDAMYEFATSEFLNIVSEKAEFHSAHRLKTEANLWPNIYKRECTKIGVECTALDTDRTRIKSLVSRRNDIAHGKKMIIADVDSYVPYEKATLNLMHDLAVQLLDILEQEKYMK